MAAGALFLAAACRCGSFDGWILSQGLFHRWCVLAQGFVSGTQIMVAGARLEQPFADIALFILGLCLGRSFVVVILKLWLHLWRSIHGG